MNSFSSKMAGEVQFLYFDFAELLQPGEKITSASVSSSAPKAKDPEAKNVIYGSANVDGSVVSQRVAGGKADVTYKLVATVETSEKQVLKLSGSIKVVPEIDVDEEEEINEEKETIEEIVEVAEVKSDTQDDDESLLEDYIESTPSELVRQTKTISFDVIETKEVSRDGEQYGIIVGYASTYGNRDRVNDIILPGAFTKTIAQNAAEKRPIRMYYQHDSREIIGGFNPSLMVDDSKGLKVVGEINLAVQRGKEVYALARQGVLSDFSIGYSVKDFEIKKGVRHLKEIQLWEISVVSEPANPQAVITQVKSTIPFKDLPLASKDHPWDGAAAIERIREYSGSTVEPSDTYKNFFLYYDSENPGNFTSYKLPYVDIIDGKPQVVPKALFAIAAALGGARGGLDVPTADKQAIINHVNKYYSKLGLETPLKSYITLQEVKDTLKSKREAERLLRDSGYSRSAAAYFASLIDESRLDITANGEELQPQRDVVSNTKGIGDMLLNIKSLVEKL